MKSRVLLSFIIILFCIGHIAAQEKKTFQVGVILDTVTPESEQILSLIKQEILAVVGEDAIVNFSKDLVLVNDFDREKTESNYQELVQGSSDIIIAFGPISNIIISEKESHAKPTILFGNAPSDFIDIDLTRTSSGIENLVYIIPEQSYRNDLNTFKELYEFKKVGIAVDKFLSETLPINQYLDELAQDLDLDYTFIPFQSLDELITQLENIDALYLAGGFLLSDEEVAELAEILIDKSIPSFTSTDAGDVLSGLLATNQAVENLDLFIRRIALTVEAIINGEKASELPFFLEINTELTINYNTADKLGIPIRYSLMATTNLVGDFNRLTAEKRYDLREVMLEVIGENLTLQSDQREVELVTQDVKTAKSNYLPDLTASASGVYIDPKLAEISNGQNPEFSTDASLTLSQTIFSPDATANIGIQNDLLEAQRKLYDSSQLDVIFDGANAYFNALLLKANLQITSRNLGVTKRSLQLARQNFESGQTGKSDVLQFTSQLAGNTQTLVEAVNLLEQSFFGLNQLLNQPINRKIDVEDAELGKGVFEKYQYDQFREFLDNPSLKEPFVAFIVNEAKANAPELQSLDFNLSAVNRSMKLATNGRFLPTLALQGQYNTNISKSGTGSTVPAGFSDLPITNYSVGLNISVPLFQRNQRNINKQTALIQKDQLMINKENLALNLERNVNTTILELINQIANIELSKVSEEAAKESLELTQEAYSTGAVNWNQLIDAQENYLTAQQSNATAIYNYLLQSLQLERYIGYYFILHTDEENEAFRQRFFTYLVNEN